MAVSRETKRPSKFRDCLTGDEIDYIFKNSNDNEQLEKPVHCLQVDGKTNNVTFTTFPERIEAWKNAIVNYFGEDKTTLLKEGSIIKIICDCGDANNCTIKVNTYKSGSIVIQGAKCVKFSDLFFSALKDKVHESLVNSAANRSKEDVQNNSDSSMNTTKIELQPNDNNLFDNSITFAKALIQDKNTSTPVRNNTTENDQHVESPKERIAKHGQNINSKLDNITVTLSIIDTSFKLFVNKLTELKNVTDNIVPNIKSSVPEIISSSQKIKHATQQIENMENKIKHCNQTLESLHSKVNLLDSQLKENSVAKTSIMEKLELSVSNIVEFREENKESMVLITTKIDELENRIGQLENSTTDLLKSETKEEKPIRLNRVQKVSECNYLILSDSILRRIIPKKFSPNGKTIKRFIRGGANTCCSFIQKNGEQLNPKNVLIHIGTRDLQNHGEVNSEEFENLFTTAEQMWPSAKIFIMPIIRRKDMANESIEAANEIIATECAKFETITLINKFEPSDDMFYDNVHLNNKKGLPEIVKHLKTAMKMYPPNKFQGSKQMLQSFQGANNSFRSQTMSPHGYNSNPQKDIPFPSLPNNPPRPPWIPPPTHMPPWQPPFMWNPFVQYNQMPRNFITNSCN